MKTSIPSSVLLVVTVALLSSACGDASADELAALQVESAETINQLEADLDARDGTITELEAALSGLETASDAEATAMIEEVATLNASLAEVEAERDAANERADAAEAREQELVTTYDAEIRADAQAAWDTEVASACTAAGESSAGIAGFVDFTEQLEIIGTRAELVDAVTACAQPLRDRSEEEKLDAECTTGDPDALLRGTAEFVGDCFVIHVVPFQWDSRTGACNFLARWDGANLGTRSFRYDGTGLFRAPSSVCAADLDGADQDDLLKVWVEVVGTYNYDTAAGGTNAVPEFSIVRAELVLKA